MTRSQAADSAVVRQGKGNKGTDGLELELSEGSDMHSNVVQSDLLSLGYQFRLMTGELYPPNKTLKARRATRKHWSMFALAEPQEMVVSKGMRMCCRCARQLPLKDFYTNAHGRHFGQCKRCYNLARQKRPLVSK